MLQVAERPGLLRVIRTNADSRRIVADSLIFKSGGTHAQLNVLLRNLATLYRSTVEPGR